MKFRFFTVSLFLGLVSFANPAFSTQYMVSVSGDDHADGTQKNPWKTVTRAVRTLQPGDTLIVTGGIYEDAFELKALTGEVNRHIVICAAPNRRVLLDILRSESGGIRLTGCAYVTIRGFEIVGARKSSGITLQDCHHCIIEGNVVQDCSSIGIQLISGRDNILRGNICFHNNSGIYVGSLSTRNMIEANVCAYGNKTSEHADGIGSSNCKGNTYRFNLLVGNNDDGLDMWTSTGSLIEYNLAALNGDQRDGDGNGFKLGGKWPDKNEWRGGGHTVRSNVSFDNMSTGFTNNGSKGNTYESNAAYGNRNTGSYSSVKHTDPAIAEPILAEIRKKYRQIFDSGLIRPRINPLPVEFDRVFQISTIDKIMH